MKDRWHEEELAAANLEVGRKEGRRNRGKDIQCVMHGNEAVEESALGCPSETPNARPDRNSRRHFCRLRRLLSFLTRQVLLVTSSSVFSQGSFLHL